MSYDQPEPGKRTVQRQERAVGAKIDREVTVTAEMTEAGQRVLVEECGYSGELRTESLGEVARRVFTEMARVAPLFARRVERTVLPKTS